MTESPKHAEDDAEGVRCGDLQACGWSPEREAEFAPLRAEGLEPGLIAVSYGSLGVAWTSAGSVSFSTAGKLRLEEKQTRPGLPAVGDWVALRRPANSRDAWVVQEILPRRSAFWRKMAGTAHKTQVVAANMDIIFVVSSLNRDFKPRRLERYLALAGEGGAQPVIILTKTDLAGEELAGYVEETEELDQSTPVHAVSVVTGQGMAELNTYLTPGTVVALLGSSGVGKSTLINHWLGEERMRVNELRNDDRGRHTTTHRELIRLPGGALVIDTPGMREVTLMDHGEGLDETFDDIRDLAEQCRFSNCRHENEPGCAIKLAIEEDRLDEDRLDHYRILRQEVQEAEQKRVEMDRRRQSRGGRRPKSH